MTATKDSKKILFFNERLQGDRDPVPGSNPMPSISQRLTPTTLKCSTSPPPPAPPPTKPTLPLSTAMRAPLFLLLLPLLFVAISSPRHASALPGGWTPIKNANDAHVIEIAKFAVSEHNKEAKAKLVFSKVVRGETQVVAGTNYRLIVEAKDGKDVADYEAVVWEKAWVNFRQLTSFKLVAKN